MKNRTHVPEFALRFTQYEGNSEFKSEARVRKNEVNFKTVKKDICISFQKIANISLSTKFIIL